MIDIYVGGGGMGSGADADASPLSRLPLNIVSSSVKRGY